VDIDASVEQDAEFDAVEEDNPRKIDPDQKEHDRTERAVERGVGLVEGDIVDEERFGDVPDQRSGEGADECGAFVDIEVGGDLVDDIEDKPDHRVGCDREDIDPVGIAEVLQQQVGPDRQVEGCRHAQRHQDHHRQVDRDGVPEFPGFDTVDFVDHIFEVVEKHHRDIEDEDQPEHPHLVGVLHKGVDILRNRLMLHR